MNHPRVICQVILSALLILFGGACLRAAVTTLPQLPSSVQRAQELQQVGEVDAAVKLYREHMERRRQLPTRPENENPSFYRVLIGDLYCKFNRLEECITEYEGAHTDGVDPLLVLDRLRQYVEKLTAEKRYADAIKLLEKYRPIDEWLVDSDLNVLHRKLVDAEDNSSSSVRAPND